MDNNRFRTSRAERDAQHAAQWARRRDIPIAILAWLALFGLIIWAASYIIPSLLVVLVAALLAFALAPAVKLLQRWMPRLLAVIIIYIVVFIGVSLLFYEIVNTAANQITSLTGNIQSLFTPDGQKRLEPVLTFFAGFGISTAQLSDLAKLIAQQASGIVGGTLPFLSGVAQFILDVIIVAILSVYLLLDGERAISWLRRSGPITQRERINFVLDTLGRIIGGYIRGQLIMSSMVGLLVGIGMAIFGVPYAVLLGVIAFVLEFIPIVGTILSGVICVLLAFSKGWLIALLVLAYFVFVHILEGDILAPRVVGKAVGVHPAVSMFALLAGAELFGIWGAILASPLAGLIQAALITVWQDWRTSHPDQFPEEDEELVLTEGNGKNKHKIIHEKKVVARDEDVKEVEEKMIIVEEQGLR